MENTTRDKLLLEIASWCVEDDINNFNTHTDNIKNLVRSILKDTITECESDTPELDAAIKKLEGK